MNPPDENQMEKTPPVPTPVPSNADESLGVGMTPKRQLVDEDSFDDSSAFDSAIDDGGVVNEPTASVDPEDSVPQVDSDIDEGGHDSDLDQPATEPVSHKIFEMDAPSAFINKDRPIYIRLDDDAKADVSLFISPTTSADLDTYADVTANTTEKDLPWLLATQAAEMTSTGSDTWAESSVRKGALWTNMVERGGMPMLGDRRDKFKSFTDQGQNISGSDAVEMFMAGTNLGRPVVIPLWHSGFWLKMRAPSAAYLAEIDRAIAFSREELGLDVFGAIGSNDRLIFDEILVDAALKLVKESSMPFSKNPLELKEYISSFDIDSIIWGMAQASFPDGCDIGIPCPSCRNVSNVHANLLRMRFVDESRLTEFQLKHMAKGFTQRMTPDDLKKYRDDFEILNTESWQYMHNKFIYRIPSVEEYLIAGRSYLSAIGRALTETLREEYTDDNKRARAMKSMLDAEEACRFTHYIKEIRVYNQDNSDGYGVVAETDTISQILRQLSTDYDATTDFVESVRDYIVDALNVIIGFPNVKCPKCQKYHLNTVGEESMVVPFNPAIGFFTLAQHKISASGTAPLTDLTTLGVRDLLSRALVNGLPV